MLKVLLMFLFVVTQSVSASEELVIKDSHMIKQLSSIQVSLDMISDKVMSCLDSGGEHSTCLCDNRVVIAEFNRKVLSFFDEHKALANQDLIRFQSSQGEWVTQSLQGILRQAKSTAPSCS